MDIFEDDIFLPDDEKNKGKGKNNFSIQNPGTRVIYQAPESGEKRKFTGFSDTPEEAPEIIEETEEILKPEKTEKKEKITVDEKNNGYAFEENLRRNNAVPEKRAVIKVPPKEKTLSFEEEKRRRYIESLRAAERERLEKTRRQQLIKQRMFYESEMEVVDIDGTGKKKKSTADKIRMAVIIIAIIAMAVATGVLVKQLVQQKQGSDWEDEVTGLLIDVSEEGTTKKQKKKKKEETTETTTRVLTIEEQWEQLYKDYPGVEFPSGLSLKYAKLYAVNRDFVGYISIDEFGVGLPVVQSQKDTAKENYYLRKNFYKQYSVYGCPFVNKKNDMKNFDRNTTIYGHNNNSNIAFAPVNKYKTLDGYKKAPVIRFDTIYGNFKWKVFAAFIINTKANDDNGYIFNYTFMKMESDEEFMNYISFVKERSLYDTGIDILPSDKILTLSTCSHDFDDARFVVVARLVRPGETDEVNTAVAKVNEKPRFPQAYYDKKKKKNPYKNAERWFYSGS